VHVDGGDAPSAGDRRNAYLRTMQRLGLEERPRVVSGDDTEELGARGRLLRGRLPTGVFAAYERCATGLLHTLARDEVSVPKHRVRCAELATAAVTSGATRGSKGGDAPVGSEVVDGVVGGHGEDRVRGGQLHRLGDPAGTGVERPAKHAGEGQHVVDLVREVAAPGGDDRGLRAAISGCTSGSGSESANTKGAGAMVARSSSGRVALESRGSPRRGDRNRWGSAHRDVGNALVLVVVTRDVVDRAAGVSG
jgi:hypothetical protein